jgi:hypothetical protein
MRPPLLQQQRHAVNDPHQCSGMGGCMLRPLLLSRRAALPRMKPKSQKQAQEGEAVSAGPVLVYRVLCSLEESCERELNGGCHCMDVDLNNTNTKILQILSSSLLLLP